MLALLTHFAIAGILTVMPNENISGGRSEHHHSKSESLYPAVSLAVSQIMQFDPDSTPGKWKISHPQDKVEPYRPEEDENRHTAGTEGYCAVARRDYDLPEKGSLRRWVYFVVPKAPVGMKLPTRTADSKLVFSECRMGLLFL